MLKESVAALILCFCGMFATPPSQTLHAQEPTAANPIALPLSSPSSASYNQEASGWSIIHQRAMFEAEQRMLRTEYNKWIGYNPARPNMNASYLSNGRQLYYIPSRAQFVNAGATRSWYW